MKAPKVSFHLNTIFECYLPEDQWKDNPHKVLRWTNSEGVRFCPPGGPENPCSSDRTVVTGNINPKPFKLNGGNTNSRNGARGAFYSHCSSSTACHAIMLVFAENKWHKVCAWWADPAYKNHDFKYEETVPVNYHSFMEN